MMRPHVSQRKSIAALTVIAAVLWTATPFVRADLEKEDIEKKAKPALDDDVHDHDHGTSHQAEHDQLLESGEENLREINRLLDEIQNGLRQKQTGAATQAKQSEAVEKMEELIKTLGKGCSQCSSGGGGSSSPQQGQQQQQQQQGQQQQQQQASQRQRQQEMRVEEQRGEKNDEQSEPEEKLSEKEKNDRDVGNDRRRDTAPPDDRIGKLTDRLKLLDKWGVLPSRMSEEMFSSSGKEAPAEYRDIIARYYKRLSDHYDPQRGGR